MTTKEIVNTPESVRMRKAKRIASNGSVKRADGHFVVREAEKNGRYYIVERTQHGKVRCSCLAFKHRSLSDDNFRCEHLMAVRYAISLKNTEPDAVSAPVADSLFRPEPALIKTESRFLSEGGEQKARNESKEASELRHIGGVDLDAFRLGKIRGNNEMRSNTSKAVVNEHDTQNNVLNFSTTLRELRNSVDSGVIRQREGWSDRNGNTHMVDYVEWHTVADILDEAAPNWTHTVKDIRTIGEIVAVTVAITIGGITREGIGTGPARSEIGIKKAEHDALKRAAVKFGIARDLYKRDTEQAENVEEQDRTQFPENPIAQTLSDIVTGKQLRMIRAIARESNIDVDAECSKLMNCKVNELSKRAASALIDHIQHPNTAPAGMPLRRVG